MRILYSHYLSDSNHPAVQMVQHISNQLRSFGHSVYIYGPELCQVTDNGSLIPNSSSSSSNPANPDVTARQSIKTRLKSKVWFAKAMSRNRKWNIKDQIALNEFRPDVVLTRQDAYCWSVLRNAQQLGIPCVTYADAPVAYETRMFNDANRWHPPGLVEKIERWGLAKSKAILTVSEPARRRLEQYSLDVPITVAPNGVDLSRFPQLDRKQKIALRRELGVEGKTVIGFQGTFKMFHGIDRLKELMLWSTKFDDIAWVLIGDGPERKGLEESIQGKIDAKFLGRRPADDMGKLLSSMDIAVAPHSQLKGDFYFCPLKILEYAAAGCATLASDQGDIPKMLAHGKGGQIVSDDHLESWTAGLENLITDSDYRKQMGQTAQQFIRDHHTWRHTASTVERVLCQALGMDPPIRAPANSTKRPEITEKEPVLTA